LPTIKKIIQRKIDLSPLPEFEIAANFKNFSPVAYDLKSPTLRDLGENVHHETHLPELEIRGTVVYVKTELVNRRHRLCIRVTPRDDSRASIAQFISQRQTELIREIKSLYELISIGQDKLPQ
jgi:hypothetical protein